MTTITVSAGQTLTDIGGEDFVTAGGVAVSSSTSNPNDTIIVLNGGTTVNLVVGAGGTETVSAGGTANATSVLAGGFMSTTLSSIENNTVVYGGGVLDLGANLENITTGLTIVSATTAAPAEIEFASIGSSTSATITYAGGVLTGSGGGRTESVTVALGAGQHVTTSPRVRTSAS